MHVHAVRPGQKGDERHRLFTKPQGVRQGRCVLADASGFVVDFVLVDGEERRDPLRGLKKGFRLESQTIPTSNETNDMNNMQSRMILRF